MTDTTGAVAQARTPRSGLAAMNVVELKGVAAKLGITGTTKMRKDDLVSAIAARQSGGGASSSGSTAPAAGDGGAATGSQGGAPARRTRGRATAPAQSTRPTTEPAAALSLIHI